MKNYFLFVFLAFLLSCSNTEDDCSNCTKIIIDLNNKSNNLFSSIIDEIHFTPLEQNDSCLIRQIDKIDIVNDNIYILDRSSSSIFVFNKLGDFLWKVSEQGRGPQEYYGIGDCAVNPLNENIYVLDPISKGVKVFNKHGFLKNIKADHIQARISGIHFLDSQRIALLNKFSSESKQWKYQLLITDENLNVISKQIPYNTRCDMVLSPIAPFSRTTSGISYLPVYENVIFNIDKDNSAIPKYIMDFGRQSIDKDYMLSKELNPMNLFKKLADSGQIYQINYVESVGHLLFYFKYKKDNYLYCYNKQKNSGVLVDDLTENFCGFNELPIYTKYNYFVGVTGKNIRKIIQNKITSQLVIKNNGRHQSEFSLMYIKLK